MSSTKKTSTSKKTKTAKGDLKSISKKIKDIKENISKVIVGQEEVVEALITAVLIDGHVLLEGVPGIAKH